MKLRTIGAKLNRRVDERRRVAALMRELGEHVGAAARDPDNLTPRRCPVCDASEERATPALHGPVYAFARCRDCAVLYVPRVLRGDVTRRLYAERPIYREYWEHMRADAAAMRGQDVYAPLIAGLLAATPGRDVAIDVGCRFGKLAAELRPHFREAFGLELNRRSARVGADLFGADIRPIRLEQLTLPAGSVDLIVMNQVLEHLHEVRSVVEAARRLLRPGGALWIGIPHGASLGLRVAGAAHAVVATHMHVNLFTAPSLRRLCAQAGLEIRRLDTDDVVDLSAATWLAPRVPARAPGLAAPAFAVDRAVRALAGWTRWPSRLGLGAHLEALAVRPC